MMGADAGFLYAETERQPSTTPIVVVLRPGPGPDGEVRPLTGDDLRAHVEARLDLLPSFRRRVERVPFGLHHPELVDDPDFDLGYHVRHVALDGAGALDAFVAARAEEVLDRRHPLWRATLVDGLHDGRQHLVLQWSHALADGTAARTTLRRLLTDVDPGELAAVRRAEPFRPAPVRRGALLADGLRDLLRSLLLLPRLVWRASRRFDAVKARRAASAVATPEAADTPVTRLNDAWSGRRRHAGRRVPLAPILRVKAAAGATVNDVFLAMGAGALRSHLAATGDLPERPLTVNVPVSTEPDHPAGAPDRQHGNHFSNFLSSLATDVDDPVERLRVIRATTAEGRAQLDVLGATTLVGLLDHLPPLLAEPGARWMAAQKREHPERADYSVLLSNVRGAADPFRFTAPSGATVEVERITVLGTTFDGTGLSLVGWTYGDQVELSALSDAEAVPDPGAVLDGMVAALDELAGALGVAGVEEREVAGATPQR